MGGGEKKTWLGMEEKDVSGPVCGTGPAGGLADASIPVSLHLGRSLPALESPSPVWAPGTFHCRALLT